jgi:hypothetical protein
MGDIKPSSLTLQKANSEITTAILPWMKVRGRIMELGSKSIKRSSEEAKQILGGRVQKLSDIIKELEVSIAEDIKKKYGVETEYLDFEKEEHDQMRKNLDDIDKHFSKD